MYVYCTEEYKCTIGWPEVTVRLCNVVPAKLALFKDNTVEHTSYNTHI